MLSYVSQQGYAVFGWWRIILGLGVLAALFAGF
jgi:undecaprenyl pyrophosphate phosphatase UppP